MGVDSIVYLFEVQGRQGLVGMHVWLERGWEA